MNGEINSEMGALALAGIMIVFGVLAVMALVVTVFKRLDDHWQEQERVAEAKALSKAPTIDTVTLLLISTAAATVVAGRFRVRRIRRLRSLRTKRTPWSAQGRLTLQGSHTVRRQNKKR